MPLQLILTSLLAKNKDAIGALLLDDSGEAVDLAFSQASPYEVRVLGAYLGIYLRQLDKISREAGLGAPRSIHIERPEIHIFAVGLSDGYYLVLLLRQPAVVGRATRSLAVAAEEMEREVFGT